MTRALMLAALLTATGCPKRAAPGSLTPRAFRLLAETAERETTQLTQVRNDLEVDTRDFERTPRVVATGETALFTKPVGAALKLYGDERGSSGFAVDNAIFLEVIAANGAVRAQAVIGSIDPVTKGSDTIDSLGRMAFSFEAGELDLGALAPDGEPIKLRATVLDISGVGRVSDVFVRLEPAAVQLDEWR